MLRYRLRAGERQPFPRPDGMNPTLHSLLVARGIASAGEAERYLHPSQDDLQDPFALNDMDRACARIRRALENGEAICVYGDYDVDGVSASAILADHLRSLGGAVEVYLPSRHAEGYGLNDNAVRSIAERAKLLVTVDCGVTNVAQVALANSLGLDCVVTDHHQPPEVLPDCPVVNPLLNDYPRPSLCGAGVALKVVEALSGRERALAYVDIAALATVADVVPLAGENRIIVSLGLKRMNNSPRPGIDALRKAAGLEDKPFTSGNIAFQLAPRLNASGRMGSAMRAHNLLLAKEPALLESLAAELEAENSTRRNEENAILDDVNHSLAGFDFLGHRAIVLWGEEWNAGVIGLAASRVVERWHYPTILLTRNNGDETCASLTGSCRSIPGVDIYKALCSCSDLFTRFGGHPQAAGLTLPFDKLDELIERLDRWLRDNVPADCWIPEIEYDLECCLKDMDAPFVAALGALQPCGYGNPSPVFRTVPAQVMEKRSCGASGAHLQLTLMQEGCQLRSIYFGGGALAGELPNELDALYAPEIHVWKSFTSVQLQIKALKNIDAMAVLASKIPSEDHLQRDFLTKILYNGSIIRDGADDCSENGVKTVSPEALRELLKDPQGTLIVCADLGQAGELLRALDGIAPDLAFGNAPGDPRRFNALWCYPAEPVPAGWKRVVFLASPVLAAPEGAERFRVDALPSWFQTLPDVDGLRGLYMSAKKLSRTPAVSRPDFGQLCERMAVETGLTHAAATAGALALHDLGLMEFDPSASGFSFRVFNHKTNLDDSAVWRLLSTWRQRAAQSTEVCHE